MLVIPSSSVYSSTMLDPCNVPSERPSLSSGIPPIRPIKVKRGLLRPVAIETDWFPRNKNNHTGKSEKISCRNLQTIGTIYNCLKVENGMEIVQIIAACEANL